MSNRIESGSFINSALPGRDISTNIGTNGHVNSSQVLNRHIEQVEVLRPKSDKLYPDNLGSLLSTPPARIVKEYTPHTTVLMPVHHDPNRYPIINLTMEMIARDPDSQNLHIVFADNGVSPEFRQSILDRSQALGLRTTVIDSKPDTGSDLEKSPAHARNKALRAIRELQKQDSTLRGPIYHIDSDSAPLPGAIKGLKDTLNKHADAAAVHGDTIAVESIDAESYRRHESKKREKRVRALPKLWTNGSKPPAVDLALPIAFSSQVAGKSNNLLVDSDVMRRVIDHAGAPYEMRPYKSWEDTLAAIAYSQMGGTIYHDSSSAALDRVRETPEGVLEQQSRWGRDPILIVRDLADKGLIPPGIHVLEPQENKWIEYTVPNTENTAGYIVNPDELNKYAEKLRIDLAEKGTSSIYYSPEAIDKLNVGLEVLSRFIAFIQKNRQDVNFEDRLDLPKPIKPDPSNPRYTDHMRISRLIGNMLGLFELYEIKDLKRKAALPNTVVFSLRQAATW